MVMNSKYGFGLGFVSRISPWQSICVHRLPRMIFLYL
jgi:hypothetical protein